VEAGDLAPGGGGNVHLEPGFFQTVIGNEKFAVLELVGGEDEGFHGGLLGETCTGSIVSLGGRSRRDCGERG